MRGRHSEGGYVLLAMAAVILMSTTVYLARGLASQNFAPGESVRHQALALRDAKSALIAYAAMEDSTPGSLPCPDSDNNGTSDTTNCASTVKKIIGCLPWKTLGLPPGEFYNIERLWYVLSPEYRNSWAADDRIFTARQINPDNKGVLSLRDQTGGLNIIVAAIIAPGTALETQTHPANGPCDTTTSPGYLDTAAIGGNPYSNADTMSHDVVSLPKSAAFNDHVLSITREEVLQPVLRTVLEAFAAPASGAYGLRKYFHTPGAKFSPASLQTSGYKGANIMNRQADSVVLDQSFDQSRYGSLPTLWVNPVAAKNPLNCSVVVVPANGTSPASNTSKFPVSWLCYNNWYAYIQYTPDPIDSDAAKLTLSLGGASTYGCELDVNKNATTLENVICHP